MSKKTLAVDSDMIDLAVSNSNKLILRLEKSPKTRKDQNTIKNIQEIRDTFKISSLCEIEKERIVKMVKL